MDVLFRTIHGSFLYGLGHAGSDQDFYTVIANKPRHRKKYAKQTIHDGIDSMTVDLSTFRVYCDMGVPQALEAVFSPFAGIDHIADFRRSYRVDTGAMMERYRRTIKSFSLGGDFKRRRHALRLCLNLTEALETGRFNPRLSQSHATAITIGAGLEEDYFDVLERMMP